MATIKFLVVLILALSVFADGKILKCHQCDGLVECDASEDNLADCKEDQLFCYIRAINAENDKFTRGCTSNGKMCEVLKGITCGICQKDECNSASTIGSTVIGITSLLILKALTDHL
ncbi:PREDICTED: uncharacterized protein LOC108558604 [Nicrophorus vespilloides]|uniref:Uncharacterized protein LOC108558604 n=1 Tax=Nicrophorus vespilloides TaxID=110193 RepID=A0ABM1M912_NICVS|nr:PREDICTED: uncharacterized protein LOC108558604 [Nicrophorus vespilloides]